MSSTEAEFERGVAYWRRKPKWDQDFHNAFYEEMARPTQTAPSMTLGGMGFCTCYTLGLPPDPAEANS